MLVTKEKMIRDLKVALDRAIDEQAKRLAAFLQLPSASERALMKTLDPELYESYVVPLKQKAGML